MTDNNSLTPDQPEAQRPTTPRAADAHTTAPIPAVPQPPAPPAPTSAQASGYASVPPTQAHATPAPPAPLETQEKPAGKQRIWAPVAATAVASALLASLGTAAATGAFTASDNEPATTTNTASEAPEAVTVPVANSTSTNPDWQAVSAAVSQTVVAIEVTSTSGDGQGSGVIIGTDGRILTNNHVVEGATNGKITVTLDDGRIYDATITGLDAATDLAVITLTDPPSDLTAATFADSDAVTVGDSVIAIGNPLGLSQTATTGIVSALNRPVTTAQTEDGTLVVTNAIQIDAAINPGNSGGPLFNAKGQVIGITSSIATMSQGSQSSSSSGSIGLGFAIPSNLAQNIGDQLIDNGEAEHAFLGVSMTDGTGKVDGATRQGAVVAEVTQGSPAAEAGVQPEDIIVSINGKSVTGAEALTGLVRELQSGQQVPLGIIRDGEYVEVTVTLATKTEEATTVPQEESSQDSQSTDPTNPNNIPDLSDMFGSGPGRQG
ncbi:S1C family serine protease [Jonesia quinghaiensis]|uniref:S1C family serine protease n=1 Tax=Jonesia quinghaiensis TaxID=262806 RepID=UPI000411E09E|nr:trypsin-like peptidase domain-containing protein [Jonesia quinghaiensis]